ncbi:MAG: cardiolipin synthase [Muribaculaceae bacterium]|nr:cardiolipin synthase [Muribaculaceae bacterium]
MEFIADYLSRPWVYQTLMFTYVLSVVTVIGVIIGENRNPLKSLAWVTVLMLLPAVGLVLYFFFGRNIKNKRMISRRNKRRLRRRERYKPSRRAIGALQEPAHSTARLVSGLCGAMFYPGNALRFFSDGTSKFEALLADLKGARTSILLQYYIFEDDRIGRQIADVLIERARSGVNVMVIYDHVGSFKVKPVFYRRMKDAGVRIYPFFKVVFPLFSSRINWRNHRKLTVIDGRIGYIGGMNIADRYIDGGSDFGVWRDLHARITGPAVRSLEHSFAVDWNFMGHPLIVSDYIPEAGEGVDASVQIVTSGPMDQWNNVAHVFLRAIGSARRRVYIQTPYFLPTESLLKALQNAALSGLDVRVNIPIRSDSMLLVHASRSYVSECLKAGVKFYFFEPGMLHSKLLIVDDDFASMGSTNFDFRSFEHNFEANMMIYSREANAELTAIFMADLKQSRRVTSAEWKSRGLLQRTVESVVRLLSPIL